jgi:hypothetical protein
MAQNLRRLFRIVFQLILDSTEPTDIKCIEYDMRLFLSRSSPSLSLQFFQHISLS